MSGWGVQPWGSSWGGTGVLDGAPIDITYITVVWSPEIQAPANSQRRLFLNVSHAPRITSAITYTPRITSEASP